MAGSALYCPHLGAEVASIIPLLMESVAIKSLPACLPATWSTKRCNRFLATRNRTLASSQLTYVHQLKSKPVLAWPQCVLPWVSRHICCISVTVCSDQSCNDDSYCQWSGASPWNVRPLPNWILNQAVLFLVTLDNYGSHAKVLCGPKYQTGFFHDFL